MEERKMKNMKKLVALLLAMCIATSLVGCGSQKSETPDNVGEVSSANPVSDDQAAADEVAKLIDAIYVQERNENTDEQCEAAKAAWDALTDAQKELVSGEFADPDYFGRDTGDASKDDPRNGDEIGENELLVVSFGTSFNDSRVADIVHARFHSIQPASGSGDRAGHESRADHEKGLAGKKLFPAIPNSRPR